jgi:hypothetical protein
MELLNAMDARPIAGPSGSANESSHHVDSPIEDDFPLQGLVPFEPTGAPVEASHHVDSCEGFGTPKKVPISSTSVSNLYP